MSSMRRYIVRRLIFTTLTIFFIIFLNFMIINMAPGDPAEIMAGEYAVSDREYVELIRKRWGLDKPLWERFLVYMERLLHGDLGYSYRYMTPVVDLIAERIPATLLLTFTSLVIAFIIGVLLGAFSARRFPSKTDLALSAAMLIIYSMPVFWLGLLLMLVFAVRLRWFPIASMYSARAQLSGLALWLDVAWHLVLPATTLALAEIPVYFKVTRASVLEQSAEPYVSTFTSFGLPRGKVFRRYVLRNALLPPFTLFGLSLGYLLSGAALVEIVFAWPGMGRLLLEAAFYRDYPVLMALYMITAIGVALANLLTDVTYAILDPRVKYE